MMSDWKKLIDSKDWDGLNDFWRHDASQEVCAEILAALQKLIPVVERANGTERECEHALPHEVPADLRGAAEILCLGELEATALGDAYISTYLTQWAELLPQVQNACAELTALPEVTEGTAHMSRAHHAREASELLAFIPTILEAIRYPGDAEDEEPDEPGSPLQEHVAAVAIYTFAAGRHFQAALSKEHQPAALRYYKTVDQNRKVGRLGGQAAKKQERYEVLDSLARANLNSFLLATDVQAFRKAKELAAKHDKGATEPLFMQGGKSLSRAWYDDWLEHFRRDARQTFDK